jgi:hypothetical protein
VVSIGLSLFEDDDTHALLVGTVDWNSVIGPVSLRG